MLKKISMILDAAGSIFFKKELEFVKQKAYNVLYPELSYDKAFSVNSDTNVGATSITFKTYDKRGVAKIIDGYAGDLPRVDVDGVETTVPVKPLGAAFGYTVFEIQSAQMAGVSIDQMRSQAARRAVEEKINKIVWAGDAATGLYGLFTYPNIPSGNAPNGASGDPEWDTKTPLEIRDDINLMFRTVKTTTKSVEKPNKLALTPKNYAIVTETAISADNSTTIAQWFVKNSPYIKSIDDFIEVPELEGAGTSGVDVSVVYDNSPDKVQVELPQDVFFHEVEKRNLEYITNVTAKTGGLNVYYPMSMYILEKV